MITKRALINNYREWSAADLYIIGFVFKHMIYAIAVPEIMPRFLTKEPASRNCGENLRLRVRNKLKLQLLRKGAVCLGPDTLLISEKYNKGEMFEKLITEYFGQKWEKDCVPFWEQGDIRYLNMEIQIKLDGATLMNTKQLAKLKKRKKLKIA